MRRAAFLLGLGLLLAPLSLGAQELTKPAFRQRLSVGVHGGVLASRFSFVPTVSQRLHIGNMLGAKLRYDVERGASLQLEVNAVQAGWQEKYDAAATSYTRDLSYIETPLLAHLYLGQGSSRIFVNAGPFVGYALSERSTSSGEANMSAAALARHAKAIESRFFWGLGGGPGISIGIGVHHRLELEGRFVYGFGNIWNADRTNSAGTYVQSSEIRFGGFLSYLFYF